MQATGYLHGGTLTWSTVTRAVSVCRTAGWIPVQAAGKENGYRLCLAFTIFSWRPFCRCPDLLGFIFELSRCRGDAHWYCCSKAKLNPPPRELSVANEDNDFGYKFHTFAQVSAHARARAHTHTHTCTNARTPTLLHTHTH